MIDRYALNETKKIWSEEEKFKTWLDVELSVLKVLVEKKIVPKRDYLLIKKKARINVQKIQSLEVELKHDVIAFTTSIAQQVGESSRFFHYGLTSSDVVDTALSIRLVRVLKLIQKKLLLLEKTFLKQAIRYKKIPCIGRTHGIHAEPTSFGLKFLAWAAEVQRHLIRLEGAINEISVGKLSGAVGSYGVLSPQIEAQALKSLGLTVEAVATQVIPRDRHAVVFTTLAMLGGLVERVCVDLRHLQRTEVHEVEEAFSKGQKGSSAMPHKKNPISAENLSGCSRILRGYCIAAMENVALWHERDISHSSVERVIAPDATILLDYMLDRLNRLVEGLRVLPKNIDRNLKKTQGIYFSGHVLLALVQKGVSREQAYQITQTAAHRAWDNEEWFGHELWKEALIQEKFSRKELDEILNVKNYLRFVDRIFDRVV